MRKAVMALLSGAYLCFALTVGALAWRAGAGWGASTAILVGSLALVFTLHTLVSRGLEAAGLKAEIARLRDALRLLADRMAAYAHDAATAKK